MGSKSLIVLIGLLSLVGCGTVKRSNQAKATSQSLQAERTERSLTRQVKTWADDTLRGSLRLQDWRPGLVMMTESRGMKLQWQLKDDQIIYTAIAKPASETIELVTESSQELMQTAQTSEQAETRTRQAGIPWWLYLLAAIVLLVAGHRIVTKYLPFNPLSWKNRI